MKQLKLFKITLKVVLAAALIFMACESDLSDKGNNSASNKELRSDRFVCQQFTASNYDHVLAGRAEVFYKWFFYPYARTIGSGEELGMVGNMWWSPENTIKNSSEGYYETGTCEPAYIVKGRFAISSPTGSYGGDGDGDGDGGSCNETSTIEYPSGVTVIIEGNGIYEETVTDNQGQYEFKNLPKGKYKLSAILPPIDESSYYCDFDEGDKVIFYSFMLSSDRENMELTIISVKISSCASCAG